MNKTLKLMAFEYDYMGNHLEDLTYDYLSDMRYPCACCGMSVHTWDTINDLEEPFPGKGIHVIFGDTTRANLDLSHDNGGSVLGEWEELLPETTVINTKNGKVTVTTITYTGDTEYEDKNPE